MFIIYTGDLIGLTFNSCLMQKLIKEFEISHIFVSMNHICKIMPIVEIYKYVSNMEKEFWSVIMSNTMDSEATSCGDSDEWGEGLSLWYQKEGPLPLRDLFAKRTRAHNDDEDGI